MSAAAGGTPINQNLRELFDYQTLFMAKLLFLQSKLLEAERSGKLTTNERLWLEEYKLEINNIVSAYEQSLNAYFQQITPDEASTDKLFKMYQKALHIELQKLIIANLNSDKNSILDETKIAKYRKEIIRGLNLLGVFDLDRDYLKRKMESPGELSSTCLRLGLQTPDQIFNMFLDENLQSSEQMHKACELLDSLFKSAYGSDNIIHNLYRDNGANVLFADRQNETIDFFTALLSIGDFSSNMLKFIASINESFLNKILGNPNVQVERVGELAKLGFGHNSAFIFFAQVTPKYTAMNLRKITEVDRVSDPETLLAIQRFEKVASNVAAAANSHVDYVSPMFLINAASYLNGLYQENEGGFHDPRYGGLINSLYFILKLYPKILTNNYQFGDTFRNLDPAVEQHIKAHLETLGGPDKIKEICMLLLGDSGLLPRNEIEFFAENLQKNIHSMFGIDMKNEDVDIRLGRYPAVNAETKSSILGLEDDLHRMFDIYLESFNPPLDKITPREAKEISFYARNNHLYLSKRSIIVLNAFGDPYEAINPGDLDKVRSVIQSKFLALRSAMQDSPEHLRAGLAAKLEILNALDGILSGYRMLSFIEYKLMFHDNPQFTQEEYDAGKGINFYIKRLGLDEVIRQIDDIVKTTNLSEDEKKQFIEILKKSLTTHFENSQFPDITAQEAAEFRVSEDAKADYVNTYLLGFHLRGINIEYDAAEKILAYILKNNLRVNSVSKKVLKNVEDPFLSEDEHKLRKVVKRIPGTGAHQYEVFHAEVEKLLPSDVGVLGVVVVSDIAWRDCNTELFKAVGAANSWIAINAPDLNSGFEIDHARTTATSVVINETYNGQIMNEVKVDLVKGQVPEDKPKNWSTEGQPTDKIVSQLPSDWFDIKKTPPIDPDRIEVVKGVLHALAKASPNNTIMISNLSGHRTVAVELAKIAQGLGYKTEFNREDGTYRTVMGRLTELLRDDTGQLKAAPWSPGWKRH